VKVEIDPQKCTCTAACAAIPGGLFLLPDGAEYANVAGDGEVDEEFEPYVQMAIAICPANAISLA
jgi:ferredoxin